MSVPNERYEREPRFPAERLLTQLTPHERGLAAAALAAFLGLTYLGPALTRLMTPKSRAKKLREAAEARARELRRHAGRAKGGGPSFSRLRQKVARRSRVG